MAITLRLQETAKAGGKKNKAKEKEAFQEGAKAAPASASTLGKGRRILVVDDNPVVLKAFEMKLKNDGFNVSTVENAAQVASKIEENKVELIVLDVNFPSGGAMTWSGFTVVQWLRRFPELAKVPVIFISGSETAQYRQKAMEAGAVAFFEKPVTYQDLLSTILRIFEIENPAASQKTES